MMNYQTFEPHPDLSPLVKFYWTLEVPAQNDAKKQQIIPDGGIEMAFILGNDIKRYITEDVFILQPRAMVLVQRNVPFSIEPVVYFQTFAVSFYPYGFANFITEPIKHLVNKETALTVLFEELVVKELEQKMRQATDTNERIEIIEDFLFAQLNGKAAIDKIVKTTIAALISTKGSAPISEILQQDRAKRRQLERKFAKQIGISPKQLGKVIRLQTALKLLLNEEAESLTHIAYESEYYDQAHFIKDFKEFTGMSPKSFLGNKQMALSSLFYK